MSPTALPPPEKLNPWQLWQYFSNPQDFAAGLRARHGALAPTRFFGQTYVLVLTPQAAQEVFAQDPSKYEAFWSESFSALISKKSVWVLAGEAHRRERRLFAPATHASHFRAYGDVIRDISRLHFGNWRPGLTIRAVETTKAIALDVIMRLVFGVEDDALMDEGRTVLDTLTSRAHPFIVFYPKLQRSWFPLFRRYLRSKVAMYDWACRLMKFRRARGQFGGDVLGVLMQARDEQGELYSDETVCDELLSILSAGHVTTGVALAWTLYELGRHPNVLAKLREELEAVGSEPDASAVLALPYLSAVCNEAIRLHPILAECARVPIEPVEILGFTIPPGQPLTMSIVGIHHDPATYPDPESFRPERFLERTYSKTEFMPFGGAHRRCLGAGLAEYTMRIAVAECAKEWNFESAASDRDIRHDLAMGPKYGVPLRVLARRQPTPRPERVPLKALGEVH
jgi:cytochrome P450 family 110